MSNERDTIRFLLSTGITIGLYLLSKPVKAAAAAAESFAPTSTPTAFIKQYYPFAKASESSTGVPVLVTLAQAGLESGWGKHAPGYNFFGITAGSSWNGETQLLKTWECGKTGDPVKDKIKNQIIAIYAAGDPRGSAACTHFSYRVNAKFRKYANPGQSFLDHGIMLRSNSRYAKAFLTRTPENFAREIAAAGYATLDTYASFLITTMNKVREIVNKEGISGRVQPFSWIDPGTPARICSCKHSRI